MSFVKTIVGFGILLLSFNCQAGLADFFCLQDDSTCADDPSQKTSASLSSAPVKKLSPSPKKSSCVVVKGSASTEGVSEHFARKMAIRDALKSASLKSNVSIHTDQTVQSFQLTKDSTRFMSKSNVKSYTLLEEGFEDLEDIYGQTKKGPRNYEVTLNVCLTEEQGLCGSLAGNQYQTRLAIAPVVMPNPREARDISNLLFGYQQELERRIKNKGYQNFTLLKDPVELQSGIMVSPNLDPELLAGIRDRTGAQYLLLTAIRSLSAHNNKGVFNDVKRFYNLEVKPDSRFIESDWYLVDLMSHQVVHQARGGFDLSGSVVVGRDKPFGTNAFFSTDTGMAFHALLENQTRNVLDFLHCKPFESQVIDVRDGEYIVYLNADSGAKVGDDLAVYHKTGRPIRFNGVTLGSDLKPGAFLKIKRILPNFAITEITAKKGIVQIGDVVKTW